MPVGHFCGSKGANVLKMQIQKQVTAWMQEHREEIVRDIFRLVRIPSISNLGSGVEPFGQPCRDVLDEMLQIGREQGFHTKNYEYRCGALWLEGTEEDAENSIGFWGHLDVVPPGNNWEYSPFEPFEKDGWLIGRGVEDNKGSTVAILYLIRCLKELGITGKYPLRLFVGCDEERGMEDVTWFAKNHPCPKISIVVDSSFPVCYGEKGIIETTLKAAEPFSEEVISMQGGLASNIVPDVAEICVRRSERVQNALTLLPKELEVVEEEEFLRITARGKAGHTAFPEGSVNAIERLIKGVLYAELLPDADAEKLFFMAQAAQDCYGRGLHIACKDELSGDLTCVGSMCGMDDSRRPWLHFNIRYPITADAGWLEEQIRNAGAAWGFAPEQLEVNGPNYFPKENQAVEILSRAYADITGDNTEPFVMGGGTYARKLPRAFAYGPGFPGEEKNPPMVQPGHGGAHGPDEALSLESLFRAAEIIAVGIAGLEEADW